MLVLPTEELSKLKKQLVQSQTQLDEIREVSLQQNTAYLGGITAPWHEKCFSCSCLGGKGCEKAAGRASEATEGAKGWSAGERGEDQEETTEAGQTGSTAAGAQSRSSHETDTASRTGKGEVTHCRILHILYLWNRRINDVKGRVHPQVANYSPFITSPLWISLKISFFILKVLYMN